MRFRPILDWLRREPLVHFFGLGLVVFLLFQGFSGPGSEAANQEIIVSSGHVAHLKSIFSKTRRRSPTQEELKGLIDDYVLEEVFYREAKAIGLDQDDTIIRRRLRQKMDFLIDDYGANEPSEEDLKKFLVENPDRFRIENLISFEHIFFKEGNETAAKRALHELKATNEKDVSSLGEAFSLPSRFELAYEKDINSLFGEDFKNDLLEIKTTQWGGPIRSPYGWHLVKIHQRIESRLPKLEEIRAQVSRDWSFEQRKVKKQEQIEAMISKYQISIEQSPQAAQK